MLAMGPARTIRSISKSCSRSLDTASALATRVSATGQARYTRETTRSCSMSLATAVARRCTGE
jgi:hypothetical protein